MATINISSGGIDTKLIRQAAELTNRRATEKADEPSQREPLATHANEEPAQTISIDDLHNMVVEIQESLDNTSAEPLKVAFRMDERAEGFVIQIRDENGELVRQFPPEKVLNLRSKLDELSGMVIDEMT